MFRAALIVDSSRITKWQKNALDAVSDLLEIKLVLSCSNTRTIKNLKKNCFYYLLNILTLKNHLTRKVKLDQREFPVIEFESTYEGIWQRLPSSALKNLEHANIELVIKFGMSLLRIDEKLSGVQILSFHHGDPRYFRGRPAGFYELLTKANSVGVIVQELSNRIDSGKVWAICHSKIAHHSYKKTAINFYTNSQFLLRKALLNLSKNKPFVLAPSGENYKLPGNLLVIKFFAIILARKLNRLIYGAFYEKKWNIGLAERIKIQDRVTLDLINIRAANVPHMYSFYADPFFSIDGSKIRCEALNLRNGLGEIVELDSNHLRLLNVFLKGKHFSYPFSFESGNKEFLIPEVASHSSPYMLSVPLNYGTELPLRGLENFRVVDPTILEEEGRIYLFCGMVSNAYDCLSLFTSEGYSEKFEPHPLNPIVIDPSRARMGGRIIRENGRLYRFGQNNSNNYGNGISICEITKLSKHDYEEKVVGLLHFKDANGPHTIDVFEDKAVIDFYVDKFDFFAWYRRLVPHVLRRSVKSTL